MTTWEQASDPRLILASASAARRALLDGCGLRFSIVPSGVDETAIKDACRRDGRSAGEAALALAIAKADVVSKAQPGALVIGADQILSVDDVWFDKPATLAEAGQQLRRLSGRAQTLHTAAVLARDGYIRWSHLAEPVVTLRRASDAVLDAYLVREGQALLDTVGACRVEGTGQLLIEHVEGEHAAILGLPLLALLAALRAERVLPT